MYETLLLLHILAVIIAFGPQFAALVNPAGPSVRTGRMVEGPALILAGLFGILLVVTAEGDAVTFASPWISAAFALWFIQNGLLHGLVVPARKAVEGGDASATGKLNLGHGALNVSVVVMLFLMIWQPGS